MKPAAAGGQIPLALALKDRPGFDLFIAGENRQALQTLTDLAQATQGIAVYLWGPSGNGVSHLLQAACMSADSENKKSAYVPLLQAELTPAVLENLEQMDMVCIDDIDHVAGNATWEQALLHLYNRLHDAGKPIVIGAHQGPQAISINLPDLKSRLGWGLVYHLKALDDRDRIEVLQRRARARAFELPDEVAEYIVRRLPRDLPSLIKLLDELEQATLAEQRKLTIPFVKTLLVKKPESRSQNSE